MNFHSCAEGVQYVNKYRYFLEGMVFTMDKKSTGNTTHNKILYCTTTTITKT